MYATYSDPLLSINRLVYLEQRYKGCFGSFPHCKQHGRLFEGGPWTNGLSISTYSPASISLDAIKCLK